jgi:hypothetical protein
MCSIWIQTLILLSQSQENHHCQFSSRCLVTYQPLPGRPQNSCSWHYCINNTMTSNRMVPLFCICMYMYVYWSWQFTWSPLAKGSQCKLIRKKAQHPQLQLFSLHFKNITASVTGIVFNRATRDTINKQCIILSFLFTVPHALSSPSRLIRGPPPPSHCDTQCTPINVFGTAITQSSVCMYMYIHTYLHIYIHAYVHV